MGFNSTIMICNDYWHSVRESPAEFLDTLNERLSHVEQLPLSFGFKGCVNGFWAVANHHADYVSLIAVGGNYASILWRGRWGGRGHHSNEDQVELLRKAADKLGFRLVKKRK